MFIEWFVTVCNELTSRLYCYYHLPMPVEIVCNLRARSGGIDSMRSQYTKQWTRRERTRASERARNGEREGEGPGRGSGGRAVELLYI